MPDLPTDVRRTLFHLWQCPYSQRARVTLREKDLVYESVVIDTDDKPAAMLRINPHGGVPTLADGDLGLYDSQLVCEYLDEQYGGPRLMPAEAEQRARVRMLFVDGGKLGGPVYTLTRAADGADVDPDEAKQARETLKEGLEDLAGKLGDKDYVLGYHFGMGDIAVAPFVLQASSLDLPHGVVPASLEAWMARIRGRESVAREIVAHLG